ncbi:MAG TPA: thymidylate synthase [Methanocorpusculum sp.]|nr:thymidylate synthase [Methanocorpusculum sp.]
MKLIRAPNLGRAHELAVQYVLENGYYIKTENGEDTIESDELCIFVSTPLKSPKVSSHSRFKQSFLDEYTRNLINGSESVFEYDYHERLFEWGNGYIKDRNGIGVSCNQVQYIIDKLRSNPESRRAIGVTWCPVMDNHLNDCPCLQLVQCVIRNNKLNMRVVFRSNDMLSAAGANMYALVGLQQHIAEQIGLYIGSYTHISLVPHIYFKRDIADIPNFCQLGKSFVPNTIVCQKCNKCNR